MPNRTRIPAPPSLRAEIELRSAIVSTLRASGIAIEEHVLCAAGTADLVTPSRDVIIECKFRLTRTALYQAIGQVLLYRHCLNPEARAIIIGYAVPDTEVLLPLIAALGIEVVHWVDGVSALHELPGIGVLSGEDVAIGVPLTQPASLHWNIAALAEQRGIMTPSALATHMGVGRQGLYGFWNDVAGQVTLEQLARFLIALEAEPGDWFVWDNEVKPGETGNSNAVLGHRILRWNIAAQGIVRGFDARRLGYRAEIQPRTAETIWQGTARAVSIPTLGRLAHALDIDGYPFYIGTLFAWHKRD